MRHPRSVDDENPESRLVVFHPDQTFDTYVEPEGPATWIIGDRWITVARGSRRMVGPVAVGVRARLASEADVVAGCSRD